MFLWFHWCSSGFIDAPVVSLMLLWFHLCSCGFKNSIILWFYDVHVVSLMFIDVHVHVVSFMFMWFHCIHGASIFNDMWMYMWNTWIPTRYEIVLMCTCDWKGPRPRSFWSSQLLHQTILSYEPMSHPSKLIKCNKGLSKVGLSLKYIKVQRKYGLIAPHDVEKFWSIYNIDKFV